MFWRLNDQSVLGQVFLVHIHSSNWTILKPLRTADRQSSARLIASSTALFADQEGISLPTLIIFFSILDNLYSFRILYTVMCVYGNLLLNNATLSSRDLPAHNFIVLSDNKYFFYYWVNWCFETVSVLKCSLIVRANSTDPDFLTTFGFFKSLQIYDT